jgi:dienelactone hydrolase
MGSPAANQARYDEAAHEIAAAVRALVADRGIGFDRACVIAVGHSIGGAAAVLAMTRTPDVAAAINIDGDFAGASRTTARARPILYLTGQNDGEGTRSRDRRRQDWMLVAGGSPAARRVEEPEMRHLDILDAALLPEASIPGARRRDRFGPLGGREAHRRIDASVTGFLDHIAQGCPR